jgi:hypothetical protein
VVEIVKGVSMSKRQKSTICVKREEEICDMMR